MCSAGRVVCGEAGGGGAVKQARRLTLRPSAAQAQATASASASLGPTESFKHGACARTRAIKARRRQPSLVHSRRARRLKGGTRPFGRRLRTFDSYCARLLLRKRLPLPAPGWPHPDFTSTRLQHLSVSISVQASVEGSTGVACSSPPCLPRGGAACVLGKQEQMQAPHVRPAPSLPSHDGSAAARARRWSCATRTSQSEGPQRSLGHSSRAASNLGVDPSPSRRIKCVCLTHTRYSTRRGSGRLSL